MSKEARKWAEGLNLPDPTMKGLLLQLAYMHQLNRKLFPSQGTLAKKIGLSPRSVWEGLKLLEAFQLIRRRARSNGFAGRTSDEVELLLDTAIAPSKAAITLARKGLRNSRQVRSATQNLQLAPGASPPRTWSEGIGEGIESLSHNRQDGSVGHCTRDEAGWTPKVIGGGRS